MPTPQQLDDHDRQRGLFLNALWDNLRTSVHGWGEVSEIVSNVPELAELDDQAIASMLNSLITDRLIEPLANNRSMDDMYEPLVKLTSAGNVEVSQWVRQGDKGTEHLAMPYNQTMNVNNIYGNVSGSSFVSGSSHFTVTVNADFGQSLQEVAEKAGRLLEQTSADPEDRDEVEADIVTVREAATAAEPTGAARSALRRLLKWAKKTAVAGTTAAASTELQQLISHVLPQLGS